MKKENIQDEREERMSFNNAFAKEGVPMGTKMILQKSEIDGRIAKFYTAMNLKNPDWDTALIINNVNQYYFTGTMQDAVLVFKRSGDYKYFVRKSYPRALESALISASDIVEMSSYKDIADIFGADFKNCYIEEDVMPVSTLNRIRKYVNMDKTGAIDALIKNIRAVKSEYELECMKQSGFISSHIVTDVIPKILVEGMSEVDFYGEVHREMLKLGFHGIARFSAFQTEVLCGQFSFGESNLLSAAFNGPSGNSCDCPAVPALFSRKRKLKKGDLVFADFAFGINGYHSDKTQIYIYKGKLPDYAAYAHNECIKIINSVASKLKPGNIPSKIYSDTMASLSDEFKINFMGVGKAAVKFLGHGVGLNVDEFPVIAKGFDEPLTENMTFAIEPKKAIDNYGLVGVEETYYVSKNGGICLTGQAREIIPIK